MLATDLPLEWNAQLWSSQTSLTLWRLNTHNAPRLQQLGCDVDERITNLSWCEQGPYLWLLQQHSDAYWLSQYRRHEGTDFAQPSDWRGILMQQFTTQGQRIVIYQSERHPRQFERFLKLRHQARQPQFTELSHGRFYLSLQNPREDVFIYARSQGSLLLSALAL